MNNYDEKRLDKLEERQDKLEEKVSLILQEISSFKPILNEINKNIEKLSENSVDKERVARLEDKVCGLEKELEDETYKKKSRLLEDVIKYIVLAVIGACIGFFINIK